MSTADKEKSKRNTRLIAEAIHDSLAKAAEQRSDFNRRSEIHKSKSLMVYSPTKRPGGTTKNNRSRLLLQRNKSSGAINEDTMAAIPEYPDQDEDSQDSEQDGPFFSSGRRLRSNSDKLLRRSG